MNESSLVLTDPAGSIKRKALNLGFTHVGIAAAVALDREALFLQEWLERGYQAGMQWMARAVEKRTDPRAVLPGAKSVVAVALNYYTPTQHSASPGDGKISRYAWGDDYHGILEDRLDQLRLWMLESFPGSNAKAYVDTGPVMDKAWAQRAGIGWLGKHTNVITKDRGSWVFLGELLTTLDLPADRPALDHCGTCTLCIEACPTAAIVEPYVVDSNLCLSYLTIEHRGPVTGEVNQHFDRWIFGCDVCQDVCPWNRKFASETSEAGFAPRPGFDAPRLDEWKEMSQEEFQERFKGSPVRRTKREGLLRNIGIVQRDRQGT